MGLQEPDMFVQVNGIYSVRGAKGLLKSCQLRVYDQTHLEAATDRKVAESQ